jgi:haloacetate dehalogenase
MAADCMALMRHLGHERFAVVGHDRGAYVAFRLAMDHPAAVSRLAVLDGIPIGEALARCNAAFATEWWHWFFLGNPAAGAERVINANPDAWYHSESQRPQMGEAAWADYHRAIHDPATVRAMCEDYRAGLGIDREHDEADFAAGRRVACPLLMLWATRDDMERLYGDPVAIWRRWADDVRGAPIASGHHMAEEAPDELAAALTGFLSP